MFFLLRFFSGVDQVGAHSLGLLFLDQVQDAGCPSHHDKVVRVVGLDRIQEDYLFIYTTMIN